ncbi:hypothetical protein [Mycobacterium sp.]|uniref:hypothetical protein n=1 Tax=Mycobacterium sp. TaxID=1785 RepID=UPI0025DBA73E|nr:hypothetical protein [Mycobacterium sp.]
MTAPTPQDVARSAARRFCGWHVTPVREDDEVTIDGPGSGLLVLPTLRLGELTGVVEDGVALDVGTDLYVSARGLVRKRSGACWSRHYGAITVTMTHGFAAEEALDFEAAVLSYAERSDGDKPRVVGPFQWDTKLMAPGSAFSVAERSLLEQYQLESAP